MAHRDLCHPSQGRRIASVLHWISRFHETTYLRSPSPPQALAPPQDRYLARTQRRSRHHRGPHRLSQTQAPRLPSSYTHRGRYYALRETARFDDAGLWSHDAVWFSRYGTLVSTSRPSSIRPRGDTSPTNWPTR